MYFSEILYYEASYSEWYVVLDKERALRKLEDLIHDARGLEHQEAFSARHTAWLMGSLAFLEEVFGGKSRFYQTLKALPWRQTGGYVVQGFDLQSGIDRQQHRAFVQQLGTGIGVLSAALDYLRERGLDEAFERGQSSEEVGGLFKVLSLTESTLRKIVRKVPDSERELQDLYESMLTVAGLDFSRESVSIEYSSKNYIPDFTVSKLDLAIEIKLCTKASREKEMIAEINDDIPAYRREFSNILFVIYDSGVIRDIDTFKGHFEEQEGVLVRVVKH